MTNVYPTTEKEWAVGSDSASHPTRLPRAMGLVDTTLFVVTAGSTLQWTATAAATGPSSLVAWLVGGLGMFVPLSVSVVYLCSRYPDECGMYTWSARAFGPFAGFITAWTYWTGTLSFLPTVLYFIAGSALLWSPTSTTAAGTPSYFVCFSLVALTFCAILNVRGLQIAKWLNSAGAAARWVGTALLLVFAVSSWIRFGPAIAINRHTIVPAFRLSDVIFWTALAFAWTGPEAVSFMSAEIKDPRRTIPKALAFAAPMIAVVYIVGTACPSGSRRAQGRRHDHNSADSRRSALWNCESARQTPGAERPRKPLSGQSHSERCAIGGYSHLCLSLHG